jgi:hypothetical protein
VFQAEIKAIEQAANGLNQLVEKENVKYVKLFCDSQAAIQALNNRDNKQMSVQDAKIALNMLNEKVKYLSIIWTKAHVGTLGNERADQLAKEGSKCPLTLAIGKPICEIKPLVEEWLVRKWNKQWTEYNEGRMSKQFIKEFDKRKARAALSFGRARLGTLIRIITGHNALYYIKNKIDKEIDSLCRFCLEDDETFWHMATECPVFWRERRDIFLGKEICDGKWETGDLIAFAEIYKISMELDGYDEIYYEDYAFSSTQNSPEPEPD